MGTTRRDEGEEAVADRSDDHEDGTVAVATPEAAEQEPTVVDLTETDKPARRFYANLADL